MKWEELTEDEKTLIRYYRMADERGKKRIQWTAEIEWEEADIRRFQQGKRTVSRPNP